MSLVMEYLLGLGLDEPEATPLVFLPLRPKTKSSRQLWQWEA